MSIELTNHAPDIDIQYRLDKKTKVCTNCSNKMRILYNYEGLPIKLCELCNIIHRYSPHTMHKGIICKTELSQLEIINKTYEFLKKKKRIPRIIEIDQDAMIIDYAFPDLLDTMKTCSNNQRKEFSKFKLFFTDMIEYTAFSFASMFWKPTKYSEYKFYSIVADETEFIKLTDTQKSIINMYCSI